MAEKTKKHSDLHKILLRKNDDFTLKGETKKCNDIISSWFHVLFAISPFNSKFSQDYIISVMDWAVGRFKHVDILLPSEADASRLLMAVGNSSKKALRKTRQEIQRHLSCIELIHKHYKQKNIKIRATKFSDYTNNSCYIRLYKLFVSAYHESVQLASVCREMSRQAILGRLRLRDIVVNSEDVPEAAIDIALPYIFAEMPFYLNSAGILDRESSVFIYHRRWPVGEGLYNGTFPIGVSPSQAFGIITQRF